MSKVRWDKVDPDCTVSRMSRCLDCGAIVSEVDQISHEGFHAILDDHANMLAVLQSSHLSDALHQRYDVTERYSKHANKNNWSQEAMNEVIKEILG